MVDPDDRDLSEVERALSVLGGRHPEQVRAERLAAAALAKRQKEHEEERAAATRAKWKRRVIGVIATVVIATVGFFSWKYFSARRAAAASIKPLVDDYVALGFDLLPTSSFAQERAEVSTVAGDCYAFVAAHEAAMQIDRPTGSSSAVGEAVVCTCASENIVVKSPNAVVRALHIAGSALGGSLTASFVFRKRKITMLPGDDACRDEMLGAYVREHHFPKAAIDHDWLDQHPALTDAGFVAVATTPPARAIADVDGKANRCFLAVSTKNDALTLWSVETGVQKPIEQTKNAMVWCIEKPGAFIVERAAGEDRGIVHVASVSTTRIGGMLGMRAIMRTEKIPITTWERDDERAALAIDTLRASVVPEPASIECESVDPVKTKDARVFVFSNATRDTFSTSDLDYRCSPALGDPESMCVQSRAIAWRAPPPNTDKPAVCAAAYGPLPYWLSAIGDARDTAAMDAELALIERARKMAAQGFSPTVIEGVTEKADSVEILGRSGDDRIFAIALRPVAPYVHPLSHDAMPLHGGEHVTLAVPADAVPIAQRRTVVFRHSAVQ